MVKKPSNTTVPLMRGGTWPGWLLGLCMSTDGRTAEYCTSRGTAACAYKRIKIFPHVEFLRPLRWGWTCRTKENTTLRRQNQISASWKSQQLCVCLTPSGPLSSLSRIFLGLGRHLCSESGCIHTDLQGTPSPNPSRSPLILSEGSWS